MKIQYIVITLLVYCLCGCTLIAHNENQRGKPSLSKHCLLKRNTLFSQAKTIKIVDFSSDGNRIVCCTEDGTIYVWDRNRKRVITSVKIKFTVNKVSFSPDGNFLVILLNPREMSKNIIYYSINENSATYSGSLEASAFDFSPDGSSLAVAHKGGRINLYGVNKGQKTLNRQKTLDLGNVPGVISTLKYSDDGTSVVVSNLKDIYFFDLKKNVKKHIAKSHFFVSFIKRKSEVVIVGRMGNVSIWNTISGGIVKSWKVQSDNIIAADLRPKDGILVVVTQDYGLNDKSLYRVHIVKSITGQVICDIRTGDVVDSVSISPTEDMIAIGEYGKTKSIDGIDIYENKMSLGKWERSK